VLIMGISQSDARDEEEAQDLLGSPYTLKFAIGQVSIRLPLDWRPLPMLALVLSFVPWMFPFFLITVVAFTKYWFWCMCAFGIILTSLVISEVTLKPLIAQPRPSTSACRHPDGSMGNGMPSGHVLMWQSVSMWFLIESVTTFSGDVEVFAVVPNVVLMLAIPWSRVYHGDHTWVQVFVSFVAGTAIGVAAFFVCMTFPDQHDLAKENPLVYIDPRQVLWIRRAGPKNPLLRAHPVFVP